MNSSNKLVADFARQFRSGIANANRWVGRTGLSATYPKRVQLFDLRFTDEYMEALN